MDRSRSRHRSSRAASRRISNFKTFDSSGWANVEGPVDQVDSVVDEGDPTVTSEIITEQEGMGDSEGSANTSSVQGVIQGGGLAATKL